MLDLMHLFAILLKNLHYHDILKGKDYTVCLLLGGNLNDVKTTFVHVLDRIGEFGVIHHKSAIYRTSAWGMGDGVSDFLNQAVIVKTNLEAEEILEAIQQIECDFGRVRSDKAGYESRTIDIDIIFFDNQIINNNRLVVPHPRLQERNFVLYPLVEIAEAWSHPILHKTARELLEESKDNLEVIRETD